MKKLELHNHGQILTTKKAIIDHILHIAHPVCYNTVLLIAMGEDTPDYRLRLYSVCAGLYYLGKFVYRGKDGIVKLSAERYDTELFEGLTETKEEIAHILEVHNEHLKCNIEITKQLVDYTYHCLQLVKAVWCNFIACTFEMAYIHEYARALEYVIEKRGDIPMPEYSFTKFLPSNYEDCDYVNGGIAAYFVEIMEGIF